MDSEHRLQLAKEITLLISPSFRLSLMKRGDSLSKHLTEVNKMSIFNNSHKNTEEDDEENLEFLAKQFKGIKNGS